MKQEDFWRETCLLAGFGKAAIYGEAHGRVGVSWRVLAISIHWHGMSCFSCSNYYDYTDFVVDRGSFGCNLSASTIDLRVSQIKDMLASAQAQDVTTRHCLLFS